MRHARSKTPWKNSRFIIYCLCRRTFIKNASPTAESHKVKYIFSTLIPQIFKRSFREYLSHQDCFSTFCDVNITYKATIRCVEEHRRGMALAIFGMALNGILFRCSLLADILHNVIGGKQIYFLFLLYLFILLFRMCNFVCSWETGTY